MSGKITLKKVKFTFIPFDNFQNSQFLFILDSVAFRFFANLAVYFHSWQV